ncbi:MAG: hypothetical protein HY834_09550 [Devosia nanyangense]|uniref:Transmembrane protein n=1 Tax=Devosia nanyangense TaxID=1228055 RepID=A0A933NYF6_9HYPH|nr:hypothetical protein [Devosia nanyangense]
MNWPALIRKTHRWLAIAFTLIVITNFIAFGMGQAIPWLYYLPLPPLFLMIATGLYMFALPYVARWRNGQSTGA